MELEELDDELLEELDEELDELLGRLGVVEEDGASPPPLHPVRSTAESTTPAVRMRRA